MVNSLSLLSHPALKAARPSDAPPAPAPAPAPTAGDATFGYNAQDETVMPSVPTVVHGVTVDASNNVSVEKAVLATPLAKAADGTFVFPDSDKVNAPAALSFAAVAKTIETFQGALGQPISWAFGTPQLTVRPDAGEDFNAYYSRDTADVNFFHDTDPKTNQLIMSGQSGEVVSHETGHALLDSLRPAYFSSFTPDVAAFHESFGDMMGILMSFQDDRTIQLVAQQTGGDLTKQNAIAATGEELGIAINDYVGQNATGGPYVRDAINSFKYIDPNTLPSDAPPDQLSSEAHSFSRLWTGAFYDVLTGIQARNMAAGMDAATALKATGAEGLKMLANLTKDAPQGDFTYRDMANAFVQSDKDFNNGANADLITKVMTDRGILGDQPTPPPTTPPAPPSDPTGGSISLTASTMTKDGFKPLADNVRPVSVRLSGNEFGMFQGARVTTLVDKDGSLGKDAEVSGRVKSNVAKLIQSGRIRYNDPSYKMQLPKDLFDAQGRPYVGYVRWENGEMVIERSKVAN